MLLLTYVRATVELLMLCCTVSCSDARRQSVCLWWGNEWKAWSWRQFRQRHGSTASDSAQPVRRQEGRRSLRYEPRTFISL